MRGIGVALLMSPSVVAAQGGVVIGQVVVKDPRTPLGYSAVSVAAPETRILTGESGKFVVRNLPVGPVRVSVRHVGFGPKDTTITLGAGDTVRLEMALSRLVIVLPGMLSTSQCTNEMARQAPEGALAELFDQVKQNAERYRMLARARPFSLQVYRVRGFRNAEGKIEPEVIDTVFRDALPAGPYEPKRVIRKAKPPFQGNVVAIPELPDFADTNFTNNHCFRFAGQTRVHGDSVIRVDYEPVPWLEKETDISGSIYLRVEDYQLVSTVTVLNKMPSMFRSSGMQTLAVTAKFSEIVPGIPVLDEWVLESRYRGPRQPPSVELGQIMSVVFDTAAVKPDTVSHHR
jgi:hypothetical protein